MAQSPAIETHIVEVYTDTLKIIGALDIYPARRVSDVLNQREHSFLFLEEASFVVLGKPETSGTTKVGSIVVNKDEIIFVSVLQEDEVVGTPVWRAFHRIKKRPCQVVIGTASFLIRGCIHLGKGVCLREALPIINQRFIAVTDAHIVPLVAKAKPIQKQLVIVNKDKISVFQPEA